MEEILYEKNFEKQYQKIKTTSIQIPIEITSRYELFLEDDICLSVVDLESEDILKYDIDNPNVWIALWKIMSIFASLE